MSWIEKERKKRQRAAERDASAQAAADSQAQVDGEHAMRALWQRFEAGNAALPAELQLLREEVTALPDRGPRFLAWLRAPNGAALGFTGDAVRYVWPERRARSSNNFWIRWNDAKGWLEVSQRVSSATPPMMKERRFDEGRIELVLKGLVQGRRVKAAALRRKRFWLF
jgi:hypothetical protein